MPIQNSLDAYCVILGLQSHTSDEFNFIVELKYVILNTNTNVYGTSEYYAIF